MSVIGPNMMPSSPQKLISSWSSSSSWAPCRRPSPSSSLLLSSMRASTLAVAGSVDGADKGTCEGNKEEEPSGAMGGSNAMVGTRVLASGAPSEGASDGI